MRLACSACLKAGNSRVGTEIARVLVAIGKYAQIVGTNPIVAASDALLDSHVEFGAGFLESREFTFDLLRTMVTQPPNVEPTGSPRSGTCSLTE